MEHIGSVTVDRNSHPSYFCLDCERIYLPEGYDGHKLISKEMATGREVCCVCGNRLETIANKRIYLENS